MNGLLFPGQGSQSVGMGREICETTPEAVRLLQEACDVLSYDLKKLMFEGPADTLTNTKYAQPAVYTCSAMYLEKVKQNGIEYAYTAGHSLGEYSALLAAGVYKFADGLRLVARRGEAMSRMNGRGTMAAVLGMTEAEVGEILPSFPGLSVANLNAKTQIVLSGPEQELDRFGELAVKRENVRFRKLHVSAAFHSPQMEEAAEEMRKVIHEMPFSPPRCKVVSNVTGVPTDNVNELKENLIAQMTGQVRWYDSILAMKAAGVTLFYEVGWGEVLRKLNKTITFRPKCVGVDF